MMLFPQAFKPKLAKWEEKRANNDFDENLSGHFFRKKKSNKEEGLSVTQEDVTEEVLNKQIDEATIENKELIKKEFVEEEYSEKTNLIASVEEVSIENIEIEIEEAEEPEKTENLPVPVTDFSAKTLTCRYLKGDIDKPYDLAPPKPFANSKKEENSFEAKMLKGEKVDKDLLKIPKSGLKPNYKALELTDKLDVLAKSVTDFSYQLPKRLTREEDLQVSLINKKRKKVNDKAPIKKEEIADEPLLQKSIKVSGFTEEQESRTLEPKNIPQDYPEIEQEPYLDLMKSSDSKKDQSDIEKKFDKEKEEPIENSPKKVLTDKNVNIDFKTIGKRKSESAINFDFKTTEPNNKSKENLINSSVEKMRKAEENRDLEIEFNDVEKPVEKKTYKTELSSFGKDNNKEKLESTISLSKSLEINRKELLYGSTDQSGYPTLNKEQSNSNDGDAKVKKAKEKDVFSKGEGKIQKQMLDMFQQFEEKMQGRKPDESVEPENKNTNDE